MDAHQEFRVFHVVLVSPGDVAIERDAAEAVLQQLNKDTAHPRGIHLEVRRWETDGYPGLDRDGPQGLLDKRLGIETSDLVVAILWSRLGTLIPSGQTATEHELQTAWDAWQLKARPQVLLYFCNRGIPFPTSAESPDQLRRVLEFRDNVKQLQPEQFWNTYIEVSEFAEKLRSHVSALIPSAENRERLPVPARPGGVADDAAFLDRASGTIQPDHEAVRAYRQELREALREELPDVLSDTEFLSRLGVLLPDGQMTRAGALLFTREPTQSLPTAGMQCVQYDGTDKSADRFRTELRGTAAQQIVMALDFVRQRARPFEAPSGLTGRSEVQSQFPMLCLREVIANAVVHRDYADPHRMVHLRLFDDRVEVASPGKPINRTLRAHREVD